MKIVSFGQQVLLDADMTVINQITVELPGGRQVSVPTSELTVQTLMKLHMGISAETEVTLPSTENVNVDTAALGEYAEDEDYDPGEMTSDTMGTLAETPADLQEMPPQMIGHVKPSRPQPRVDSDGFMLPPKARTVPKDEMGYPIVSKKRVIPQQRQQVADEDGEQI